LTSPAAISAPEAVANAIADVFSGDKSRRDEALAYLTGIEEEEVIARHFVPGVVDRIARLALNDPSDAVFAEYVGGLHAVAAAIDPDRGIRSETLVIFQRNVDSLDPAVRQSALSFLQIHGNVSDETIRNAMDIYDEAEAGIDERNTAGFLLAFNATRVQAFYPEHFRMGILMSLPAVPDRIVDALTESLLPEAIRETYRFNAVVFELASHIELMQAVGRYQFPLEDVAVYRHLYNQFNADEISLEEALEDLTRIAGARLAEEESPAVKFSEVFGARLTQSSLEKASDASVPTQRLLAGILLSNPRIAGDKLYAFLDEGEKKSNALVQFLGSHSVEFFHAELKNEDGTPLFIGSLDLSDEIESLLKDKLENAYQDVPVKEGVLQSKAPEALQALAEEVSMERLARIAFKNAPLTDVQNDLPVVFRLTTMKKLRPEQITAYKTKLALIRSLAGPKVYLDFYHHEGRSFETYGPSDTPSFGPEEEHKVIHLAELTTESLKFAQKEGSGILVFGSPDDDEKSKVSLIPMVGVGLFGVLAARLESFNIQLWQNLREDPLTDLDPQTFQNRILTVGSTQVSDYLSLKLRPVAKLNWESFLEYTKMALQAVGSAA
jgi:hypothetical protein